MKVDGGWGRVWGADGDGDGDGTAVYAEPHIPKTQQ